MVGAPLRRQERNLGNYCCLVHNWTALSGLPSKGRYVYTHVCSIGCKETFLRRDLSIARLLISLACTIDEPERNLDDRYQHK